MRPRQHLRGGKKLPAAPENLPRGGEKKRPPSFEVGEARGKKKGGAPPPRRVGPPHKPKQGGHKKKGGDPPTKGKGPKKKRVRPPKVRG